MRKVRTRARGASEQFANCIIRDIAERSQPYAELRPSMRKRVRTKNTRSTTRTILPRARFRLTIFIVLFYFPLLSFAYTYNTYGVQYNIYVPVELPPPRRAFVAVSPLAIRTNEGGPYMVRYLYIYVYTRSVRACVCVCVYTHWRAQEVVKGSQNPSRIESSRSFVENTRVQK